MTMYIHIFVNWYRAPEKILILNWESVLVERFLVCVWLKHGHFLEGRTYVTPEDVNQVFKDIGKHRIVLNTKARVTHVTEEAVLDDILNTVQQPASYMEKSEYRG